MNLKNLAAAALAGGGLLAAPQAGLAETDYPNKPIVWIAPSSAGSGFDVIARIITPKLGEVLSQPVKVLVNQMLVASDGTLAETLARVISKQMNFGGTADLPSATVAASSRLIA